MGTEIKNVKWECKEGTDIGSLSWTQGDKKRFVVMHQGGLINMLKQASKGKVDAEGKIVNYD